MNPTKLGVTFDPWKGPCYDKDEGGLKMLILGESHYHLCKKNEGCFDEGRDEYHRSLTWTVANKWAAGATDSPLAHRLPAIFGMTQTDFWNGVALYNYLQELVGSKRIDRPKTEQWEDVGNFAAFQKVIDALKPDRILVLGKSTWQNMPGAPRPGFKVPDPEPRLRVARAFGRVSKGEEIGCWYHRTDGGRALAVPIFHPAYRRFDWKDWVATVQDLKRSWSPVII